MLIIKVLSGIAFIGSVAWFFTQRDFEPAIASLSSLAAFLTAVFVEKKRKNSATQSQRVSGASVGIQSGGDVNINSDRKNSDAR
jgi:hypothetical protein